MIEQELTLKLKKFGCFYCTDKGCFVYTEHKFRVFIPFEILNKMKVSK